MQPSLAKLIVAFLTTKSGDGLLVRIGVTATLASWGVVGPIADFISGFIRRILGVLIDAGLMKFDLTADGWAEGAKIEEFKKYAKLEWEKAQKRKYTVEEKNAILKQYLETLDRFTELGRVRKLTEHQVVP